MLPLFLTFVVLGIAAFLYFHGRIGTSIFFLFLYYGLSLQVATELFLPQHGLTFILLAGTFVCYPLMLLLAFFMDVRYGWFCFDMSYSWAFVWGFAFIFMGISLMGKVISVFLM
jgi:hypothetical protein